MTLLAGWGSTAPSAAEVVHPTSLDALKAAMRPAPARGVLARGLGRSYGDAAQNAGGRVLETDAVTDQPGRVRDGLLRVPASTSIDALLRRVVPEGWFVPVTPGTRFVTIGGAVAADIHGKNHHLDGSFADHVRSMRIALPDGDVVTCSPGTKADLFWATLGGMGLTGVVLDVDVALRSIPSSSLLVDTDRAADLDGVMALMSEGDASYRYSVAWIDLLATGRHLGRSVLSRGDFAPVEGDRRPLDYRARVRVSAPLVPSGILNRFTIRAFNEAWYRRAPKRRRDERQSIPTYFHPLDVLGHWNRLYGPRGFLQWQPVVPLGAESVLRTIVERLSKAATPTVLSVLKRFGPANAGPLSFPIPGWTLSLDIPASAGGLGPLLDELDVLVTEAGGRVYLAKDSRVRAELIPAMYPRLAEWRAARDAADPERRMQSDLARRLDLLG
ncbi:MAG: FAD-binding protein [Acidimicrobiales bacterium]